jgi:hypothetical protein
MLAVTLTFSVLISVIFLLVGGVIGWIVKQHVYEGTAIAYTHPEMFDENGNVIPDEILAVRFENDYDSIEDEDEG